MCGRYREFQFHKGTIKTSLLLSDMDAEHDFNSIKVRLKPSALDITVKSIKISIP